MMPRNVLYYCLFFLFNSSLFSIEIVMKSGEIFICDFQGENDNKVRIKYKNDFYLIPKDQILSMDDKKTGNHISYRYRLFSLKDGSNIKGIVAEEDKSSYTLRTELGFLTIEKSKISKIESSDGKDIYPPSKYMEEISNSVYTKIGISISGMANSAPLNQTNPATFGAGWFIEPSILKLNNRWLFGYKGEYLNSSGQRRYDFFNNYVYIQYNYKKSRFLNFYGNFRLGASYVRYFGKDNNSISGTDPTMFLELGWQGLQFDKIFFRFGVRSIYIHEAGNGFGMLGAEISMGFNI